MASYLTRDRSDANRFMRSLLSRGYRRVANTSRGGQIPRDSFRTSRLDGRIRVAYYEPSEPRARRRIPEPIETPTTGVARACTEPGCNGPHFSRGLCVRHYRRWEYHSKPTIRERHLLRNVESRKRRKAQVGAWK